MITQSEIDGVRVLFSETKGGPLRAGLVFRVGTADEPLPRRGITHLLEHLALHTAGVADYHYNGATGTEHTVFLMQGSAEDIVKFFDGVCSSLREPPIHRLAVEKEILRTETSSRSGPANEQLPMWRHGARDYGLPTYAEFGLPAITPEDLHGWAARYFVRQNAVLWVSGPAMPEGLRLDLRDGHHQPAPAASSALPETPAYFHGANGVVVWDTVVSRETSAGVFSEVLQRELMRALRQEGGLSYAVSTDYDPRADGTAVITALADALPDKQGAVLGGTIDVLARMRLGLVDEKDVTAVLNQRCEALTQAEEAGARVGGQAINLLAGRPVQTLDEVLAETRAVTVADVARVASAAYGRGLLQTPGRSTADWAGYAAAPTASTHRVTGQAYPSLEAPETWQLVLGEEGVTVVDEEVAATVRFADIAVALYWPDGGRRLIGTDGITVTVEPTLYNGVPGAIPWLDARIPPHLRVGLPARDPSRIPFPSPERRQKAAAATQAVADEARARRAQYVFLGLCGFFALLGGYLVLGLAGGWTTWSDLGEGYQPYGIIAVFAGSLIVGTALALRMFRRPVSSNSSGSAGG